ncbi:MAG: M28 family metallopeptidase [Promethearchaeota archaeon]
MMTTKIDPSGKDMLEFVKMICDEVGPRIGGSEEERKAGELIQNKMSTFCDQVERHDFECHPRGFLDWIYITAVLYIAGVISYFFIPILSVIFIILAILIFFFQQMLLMEVVDFFFPKKKSFHVIGKIKPQNTPKKLVLLAGHHDSAYEFPLLSKLGEKSALLIISVLLISFVNIILGIIKTIFIMIEAQDYIALIDFIQVIFFIIGVILVLIFAKFLRSNKVVMGANDNLSAVAAAIECGKYFSKNKPKETELWIVSFAGEEHMRGSKRFVSKYKHELMEREAMLFNLECLSAERFLLATAEPTYLAKHSTRVIDFVKKAAEDLKIAIEVEPLKFAGSDAANFSRKGLHATTLFGLSKKGTPPDWHTENDIAERLSGERIAQATEIALHFVELVDQS